MGGLTEMMIGLGPYISMLIICSAVVCVGALGITIKWSKDILSQLSSKNETDYKLTSYKWINVSYDIFLALVSIFPLLGMLGTVLALLSLDISAEDADKLKQNFFLALDTTALGLIFSIVFKVIHSFVQTNIETAISKIDELIRKSYDKEEIENEKTADIS